MRYLKWLRDLNIIGDYVFNEWKEISLYGCKLTVAKESEHPFMAEGDDTIVERWMKENI